MSVEEITKEKIDELQRKNLALREEIKKELGKIDEDVLSIGEVTIDNPYDSHLNLVVEGVTSEVITAGDGQNDPIELYVGDINNWTLLSILSQICHEKKRLIKKGIKKLKTRLEENGLSVEEK